MNKRRLTTENANNCRRCGGKDIAVYRHMGKGHEKGYWQIHCQSCDYIGPAITSNYRSAAVDTLVRIWNNGYRPYNTLIPREYLADYLKERK